MVFDLDPHLTSALLIPLVYNCTCKENLESSVKNNDETTIMLQVIFLQPNLKHCFLVTLASLTWVDQGNPHCHRQQPVRCYHLSDKSYQMVLVGRYKHIEDIPMTTIPEILIKYNDNSILMDVMVMDYLTWIFLL